MLKIGTTKSIKILESFIAILLLAFLLNCIACETGLTILEATFGMSILSIFIFVIAFGINLIVIFLKKKAAGSFLITKKYSDNIMEVWEQNNLVCNG